MWGEWGWHYKGPFLKTEICSSEKGCAKENPTSLLVSESCERRARKNKVLQHRANTKHKKWSLDHPWRWQTYKWAQTDFLWPVQGWEARWNIWKFAVVFQMSTSSAAYSSVIHLNLRVWVHDWIRRTWLMVLSELVPTGSRTIALTLVECVCILCATEKWRFRKQTQALHNVILGGQRIHQMWWTCWTAPLSSNIKYHYEF